VNDEPVELLHGSGNVFRDLRLPNPELEQLRSILAARIIKVLDEGQLTVRKAQALTGVAAADFSRIRRVRLDRFTVDRLMGILAKLGQEVAVSIEVHPRRRPGEGASLAP
jgi:predicted XRE-type DNA-binding protein